MAWRLALVCLLLSAGACSADDGGEGSSDVIAGDASSALDGGVCATDNDCKGECAAGAIGCACDEGKACVPTSKLDAGCPGGGTCYQTKGICVGGGGGDKSFTSDTDCTGTKCPKDAKACACASTPKGMQCMPTCATDSDCPKPPDGQTLTCNK